MHPNINLLNRDSARDTVRQNASAEAGVLRDIVDEGTWLLGRIVQTTGAGAGPRPSHVALTLLLRHALGLADAADELFRAGCSQAALLQGRAIMEAHMQMLYVVGKRNPHTQNPLGPRDVDAVPRDAAGAPLAGNALQEVQDRRGSAYWVAEVRRQAQLARTLETSATEARLEQLLGTRIVPPGLSDPAVQAGLATAAASWDAILAEPWNAAVNAEFNRVRGNDAYDPHWYKLWNGPKSVRGLARAVGMAFQYDSFYGRASRTMHGTDLLGQLGPLSATGGRSVAPLRGEDDSEALVTAVVIQMSLAYYVAVTAIRPEEEAAVMTWIGRWMPVLRGRKQDTNESP